MKRALIIAAALVVGFSAPSGAWAQRRQEQPPAQGREAPADPKGAVSLQKVLDDINRKTPGAQINVTPDTQDGAPVWRIIWKAKADGRRIDFVVDQRDGHIISQKG